MKDGWEVSQATLPVHEVWKLYVRIDIVVWCDYVFDPVKGGLVQKPLCVGRAVLSRVAGVIAVLIFKRAMTDNLLD